MSEKETVNTQEQTESQEQNSQKIEIPDQTYRLEEMTESMEQTIFNTNKVIEQQLSLIDVIEKSDKAEEFKEFIEQTKQQVEHYRSQVTTLAIRKDLIVSTVKKCRQSVETLQNVSVILTALGVFEQRK